MKHGVVDVGELEKEVGKAIREVKIYLSKVGRFGGNRSEVFTIAGRRVQVLVADVAEEAAHAG